MRQYRGKSGIQWRRKMFQKRGVPNLIARVAHAKILPRPLSIENPAHFGINEAAGYSFSVKK
jgi:hypothetical protein